MGIMKKIIIMCMIGILGIHSTYVTAYVDEFTSEEKTTPSGLYYDEIQGVIEEYVKERVGGLASVGVAVFDGTGTIYTDYYGYADIENKVHADEETVYEWGSCSKLLVWVSVMQLYEQGKLELDTDIREYLPEGFLTKTKFDEPITMLQLMSHMAGWQESVFENQMADEDELFDSLEEALRYTEPMQTYKPGTKTAYSNWGTALAAFIVEELSGMDYTEYVHEYILEPLGMEHTAVSAHQDDNPWVKRQRENLRTYCIMEGIHESYGTNISWVQLYPAGAVTSTVDDFMIFAKAFVSEDCPFFEKEDTRKLMFSATSFYGDSDIAKNCHGLWTAEYAVQTLGHGGNTNGCSSMIQFDPQSGLGVVIMTNEVSESAFNYGLPGLIFGDYEFSERALAYTLSEKSDISGVYISTRNYLSGFCRIISYTSGLLPLADTDNPNIYSVLGGTKFNRVADHQWIQDNGNGTKLFIYESTDEDGNIVLEMMAQDYIRDDLFFCKAIVIIGFYLLAIVSIIILLIKLISYITKIRHKRRIALSVGDKCILLLQVIISGLGVNIFFLNFIVTSVTKPFSIISGVLAAVVIVLAIACTLILIYKTVKEKDLKKRVIVKYLLWALIGAFISGFIIYFQLWNFFSC